MRVQKLKGVPVQGRQPIRNTITLMFKIIGSKIALNRRADQGRADTVRMRLKVKGRPSKQSDRYHGSQSRFPPRKEIPQMGCPHSKCEVTQKPSPFP